MNKTGIKQYQQATRDRSKSKTEGGKIIRVEAHPIPEHPRPRRVKGRVALVGDAAGYVTKCSGEGIYFAAKSGRMCAEAVVAASEQGQLQNLSQTCPQTCSSTRGEFEDSKTCSTHLLNIFKPSDLKRQCQAKHASNYLHKTSCVGIEACFYPEQII